MSNTKDFISSLFPEYKDSESYYPELLMEKIKKLDDEISHYKKKDIENQTLLIKMFKDNQKMLENIVNLYENTIKEQKEINKKTSLSFKLIEYYCNTGDTNVGSFITKHFIDIYNYNKELFCRMISNNSILLSHVEISIFLFYEISFEEYDSILDTASQYLAKRYKNDKSKNWWKLHLLNQSILVFQNVTFNQNLIKIKDKEIVLTKFYKIFNDVEIDSTQNEPYNSKRSFFGNPQFLKFYVEASEHFASKLNPNERLGYWENENRFRQSLGISFSY
jgi:hypothetical protein